MRKLRLLSLFAGIGGFELGLERSGGFETVAQCEIDPFCNKVLAKHWPEVKRYGDIRELTADRLAADGIAVDAICGGFPCQDISNAGKCAGIEGERSGLWSEYARLVGELRPRVVFVENVSALLGRGLDRVLGDLAALGYDAWWDCIPASAVGAPHRRDRLWLVAYSERDRVQIGRRAEAVGAAGGLGGRVCGHVPQGCAVEAGEILADSSGERRGEAGQLRQRSAERAAGSSEVLAHSDSIDAQGCLTRGADPQDGRIPGERSIGLCRAGAGHDWSTEPNVGRVAHGVPDRAHRLKALGNAVVPQIPELLGRAYLQAMEASAHV